MMLKFRPDLKIIKRKMRLEDCWIVKDPISFNHFLFSGQEIELLKLFDGRRTDEEIQQAWQKKYRTAALSLDQVKAFGNRLINDNLVSSEEFGYGQLLYNNQEAKRTNWAKNLLLSPLAIRFRGINPRSILDNFFWLGWLLFHPVVVVLVMLCAAGVMVFALGHLDHLASRIPTISQFLSTQSLISLVVLLSIVKVLHELGHAMACRRCGGECFEIGLILLAFIPTLYCNVTDAWTFPERWKRLLVSFGGIYIEIILATIALIIWMLTGPSFLNAMMFNVVLLCSVNTLLVNGNPLLRYDGYYLLSDLMEEPNLNFKAQQAFKYQWGSWFRIPKRSQTFPFWILCYSFLSFFYRWFVVGSIVVMVYLYLRSLGLRVVGQYVMIFLAAGILARPIMSQTFNRKKTPNSQWGRFSISRSAFPITLFGLLIGLFFFLPIPSHVRCNLLVESDEPTIIYAPFSGKLTYIKSEYEPVKEGQLVAKIESKEISEQRREVNNKLKRAQNNLEKLNLRVNESPLIAAQIAVMQKNVESSQRELRLLEAKQAKLTVNAPIDGVVFPVLARKQTYADDGANKWQGKPTDASNLNCFVTRGEELFSIENRDRKSVTLFVGEREVDYVKPGQEIRMLFTQDSGETFAGVVKEIYEVDINLNQDLARDLGVETYQDAAGQIKSTQTPYRVTVEADVIPQHAYAGSSGRARISIPPQTMAQKTKVFFERLAKHEL